VVCRTGGPRFDGKAAALAAAKEWKKGQGRASIRRKGDSINVDVFNRFGKVKHTHHFHFNP